MAVKTASLKPGDAGRILAESTGMTEKEVLWMSKIAELDALARDDDVVWIKSGVVARNFRMYAGILAEFIDKDPKSPLYRGRPGCEEDAGRRCVLHPDHMPMMCLERIRHATPQSVIAHAYGISQSSVSRYSDYVEAFLEKTLPAGDAISERMNEARTVGEVQAVLAKALAAVEKAAGLAPGSLGRPGKTLPRNRVVRDGTHVPRENPKDPDESRACQSGKKKRPTNNVLITVNERGDILEVSDYVPGSTHDLELLRSSPAKMGIVSRSLEGKSGAMLCYEYGDKGFQGMQNDHPGAVVRIPAKRPRKPGKLTEVQKALSAACSRVRIVVECAIGRCKRYKCLRYPVRRTAKNARRTLVVVTGLVNLHMLTHGYDKSRNHRKGKKPGPKTARSR